MSIDKYLESGNDRPNSQNEPYPDGKEPPKPTQRDYDRGHFKRYFVRRMQTSDITEVSKRDYQRFEDSTVFVRFSLKWKISGPRHDVFNDAGYPVETGVEDTNLRIIENTDQRGIQDKLNDPLQHWDERNRD